MVLFKKNIFINFFIIVFFFFKLGSVIPLFNQSDFYLFAKNNEKSSKKSTSSGKSTSNTSSKKSNDNKSSTKSKSDSSSNKSNNKSSSTSTNKKKDNKSKIKINKNEISNTGEGDFDRGHGNDPDNFDEDNPGKKKFDQKIKDLDDDEVIREIYELYKELSTATDINDQIQLKNLIDDLDASLSFNDNQCNKFMKLPLDLNSDGFIGENEFLEDYDQDCDIDKDDVEMHQKRF